MGEILSRASNSSLRGLRDLGNSVLVVEHDEEAITTAGPCKVGDELGLIAGDILEIGSDVQEVARAVLTRMLARGVARLEALCFGHRGAVLAVLLGALIYALADLLARRGFDGDTIRRATRYDPDD